MDIMQLCTGKGTKFCLTVVAKLYKIRNCFDTELYEAQYYDNFILHGLL